MTWDPYEIMGVSKTFTPEELTEAMRKMAKELHPDKEDGDENKFKEMMDAYMILKDPIKRQHFDETGERRGETSFESKFREMVASVFLSIVNSSDKPTQQDLVQIFKDSMRMNIKSAEEDLEKVQVGIVRLKDIIKRVTYDGDGENIIANSLQWQIDNMDRQSLGLKESVEFLCKAKDLLDAYGYDFEKIKRRPTFALDNERRIIVNEDDDDLLRRFRQSMDTDGSPRRGNDPWYQRK